MYVTPEIEIIEVAVEAGIASSGDVTPPGTDPF